MKVLNVVGARPNFVKIAPLIAEMRKHPGITPLLVHTGQHYDSGMSDSFFRDLDIPRPDFHLQAQPGGSASQVSDIIARLGPVLASERPDVALVVGDVNSTLAGALAATRLGIPVAHVEAGLRSFDRRMPEETNRVMTDAVSSLLFTTEPSGVENLLREGKPPGRIFLAGNVMIDTLKHAMARMGNGAGPAAPGVPPCAELSQGRRYAVLTLHRQGLVDDRNLLERVWRVLQEIGGAVPIIFPVHPRTRTRLRGLGFECSSTTRDGNGHGPIHMVPPLGYLEFLRLQKQAALVLTDSGGVQEETTALGVPCLTLRENTERPFTVTHGTNTVVGFDPDNIRREVKRALSREPRPVGAHRLWDGRAAERIVRILRGYFETGRASGCGRLAAVPSSLAETTSTP
jgi:UDP-N-acetylglucosamine 2-epimerase (non-hydrolysing)